MNMLCMNTCFSGQNYHEIYKFKFVSVVRLCHFFVVSQLLVCVVHSGRMQTWACADVSCPATLWLAVNTGNYNFPHKEQVHLKQQCKPLNRNPAKVISSVSSHPPN